MVIPLWVFLYASEYPTTNASGKQFTIDEENAYGGNLSDIVISVHVGLNHFIDILTRK